MSAQEITSPTTSQVLGLRIYDQDSGAATVGGYLVELLRHLLTEGEGFSGKRPFGNSGWEGDLYAPLVKAGFVAGAVDEDGYLDDLDEHSARALVIGALEDHLAAVQP